MDATIVRHHAEVYDAVLAGQSAAQRPDCDAVEALVVEALNQKGRSASSIP